MVPKQPVLEPGTLPLSELRIAKAVMMDSKPLSALGADYGFHVAVRNFPQSSCDAGPQRGPRLCRGPRSLRPPWRNPVRCV
jgi:hypothetical protein